MKVTSSAVTGPFCLGGVDGRRTTTGFNSFVFPVVEKVLGLKAMNRLYMEITHTPPHLPFAERALMGMNVSCQVPPEELARIPREGPLVVVANHPFGGLEGVILEALLRRVRPDVKLLANYMLQCIPELRDSFIFVDPFDKEGSAQRNIASMRAAIQWVRQGHVLGVFPAGEVSHMELSSRSVTDPPWSTTVARMIQLCRAAAIPVFFDGKNSPFFQIMGLIHPRLRTLLLPHELLRRKHTEVSLRIGPVIKAERLARMEQSQDLINYLRFRTYMLKSHISADARRAPYSSPAAKDSLVPVAPPRANSRAEVEINSLPPEQLLIDNGAYRVGYVYARQAPDLLNEIGRLRELAFREVGEGTGQALDLDRFDEYYLHLFVWQRETRELIGAYRMGLADRILSSQGPEGLYTSTLFRYRPELLATISPSLELGRSFVRTEYQGAHMPLMLLWKGIARFVCLHPRYKILFGVVSISNRYQSISRRIMAEFLRQNRYLPDLARQIKPRTPPRFQPRRDWNGDLCAIKDVEEIDQLIGELDADTKGIPVLLRQYLKLNARMLGMNVDAKFGNVLDALMLIDLTQVSPALLVRYMGKPATKSFCQYHGMAWRPE